MTGYRLENCGDGIYRLWVVGADRPCGVVLHQYNEWFARPWTEYGNGPVGFTGPTRRSVVNGVKAYLAGEAWEWWK